MIELEVRNQNSGVVRAYGSGAEWIRLFAPDLLGISDEPTFLQPRHRAVADAQRHFGPIHFVKSRLPYQELITATLGQRIAAREAARQWRALVLACGQRAPGPHHLFLPPLPDWMTTVPYFGLHPLGIERRRAETLQQIAQHALFLVGLGRNSLEPPSLSTSRLRLLPGVGEWTAAVAGFAAFRDADAVRVGDFHAKNLVSWALTGRTRGTDEEMLQSLEPYGGQRERVVRWLEFAGWQAPKRAPRRRNLDIASL